jgi:hypothetical protein
MKSGFLPKNERQAGDDLIAGSDRDPTLLDELDDADPEDGMSETPAPTEGAELTV